MLERVATGERIGFANRDGLVALLQANLNLEAEAETEAMPANTATHSAMREKST
jgi:hypothetical protein